MTTKIYKYQNILLSPKNIAFAKREVDKLNEGWEEGCGHKKVSISSLARIIFDAMGDMSSKEIQVLLDKYRK